MNFKFYFLAAASISVFCVITTRLLALFTINDYQDFQDIGALSILSVLFLIVSLFLIPITLVVIFFLLPKQDFPAKYSYWRVFFLCSITSILVTFSTDWAYDLIIDSNVSTYFGNLLIESLKDSGEDEELKSMILESPFLIQNYVVNLLSLLIAWLIGLRLLKMFYKSEKND
jgi:hypothetical protein